MAIGFTIEEIREKYSTLNPNIEYIEVLNKQHKNDKKMILCKCNTCNQEFTKNMSNINKGCPYCNGQKVAVEFNDIATTAPWMVEFLYDKEDGYKYRQTSNLYIMFKCPNCGYCEEKRISDVFKYGFSCKVCSDGISKPNKFARYVLMKLPELENLTFEYNSKWTNRKLYDAYFVYNKQEYVLEMDGSQHKRDTQWGTYEFQKENDDYKDSLAKENGIEIIRIEAPTGRYDIMKQGFLNSPLKNIINKNNINWKECILFAETYSYLVEICELYKSNENLTISDIEKITKIKICTIRRYLKIGNSIGLCEYNQKNPRRKQPTKIKQPSFYKYCHNYELIENYEKAKSENFNNWICHHRLLTHNKEGKVLETFISKDKLKEDDLYFDRPPEELIFITRQERTSLYGKKTKGKKYSEDVINKIVERNKEMFWWTNGIVETRSKECPDGFWRGRLKKSEDFKKKNGDFKRGSKWWTNGKIDKFCKEQPVGFINGRSNFNRKEKKG